MARGASVTISPVTGGATVDDEFMTDVDGVFACGNVLHVHDLVDYVSEEGGAVGRCAAKYIASKPQKRCDGAKIETFGGVRYTVPQTINKKGDKTVTLRLRVNNVYKKVRLNVYADGVKIYSKMRPVVTAGEMETISLDQNQTALLREATKISVGLEAAD